MYFSVYPNPFSSSTTISFSLQQASRVQIELYDVAGKKLACPDFLGEPMLDENIAAGRHEVNLNRDQLSAGIYFVKLIINGEVMMKKVVVE